MDTTPQPETLDPDRLYDQGMAHFRGARWAEAVAVFQQLQAISKDYPEIDTLISDIQLKQGLEQVQAPLAAPPPKPKRGGAAGLIAGGVALLALLAFGGFQLLANMPQLPLPAAQAAQVDRAVTGVLPTPAPNASTPAPAANADRKPGTLTVRAAEGETIGAGLDNIYLIMDASGSMLARVDEVRKIDIARTAMGDLVQNLPESSNVALRTYGRQRPDDCSDVELVTPLAPLNRGDLAAQIAAIEPINLSRTPIGSSLAQIPDDLVGATGETLVVLMSDGEENCEGDPVAVARQLHADRPNLRINVVGFNIAPELRDKLVAVANAGGGSYFDANDVTQLSAALREAIKPIYRVFDPQGNEVGSALVGEAITLPAGDYTVLIGTGATQIEQQIDVRGQMATVVTLSDADGQLEASVTRDWRP